MESKYAGTAGSLSLTSAATREMLLEGARAQVRESFPDLDDETKFEKVVEKMETLAKTGAYANAPTIRAGARSCMEDACGLIFRSKPEADRSDKKDVSRSRDNGQPIIKGTKAQLVAMTAEAIAEAKFMAREAGESDEVVARIGRR